MKKNPSYTFKHSAEADCVATRKRVHLLQNLISKNKLKNCGNMVTVGNSNDNGLVHTYAVMYMEWMYVHITILLINRASDEVLCDRFN